MLRLPELFDLERVPEPWRELFQAEAPWLALARLDDLVARLTDRREGEVHPTAVVEGVVVLEAGASIGPHAFVQGPAWIMAGAQVGHGSMLRGGVLVGPKAKVGHASEVKRSVLLGGAQVPHFNYVGDSVIGHGVNLGAGVKVANLKVMGGGIVVGGVSTGLRKLGALVGDGSSIGCNAVLAPGTVLGRDTVVYNGATVRGVVAAHSIVKLRPSLEVVERRGDEPGG
jgi:UDP-N-acetylglucosamine diphosphorylase / glucose-1-phosphate thymidylyltransferase / UDP-N-acetylgalactosamine diphosphorylase / glucosamine-1-phosphate N-acetyltransferase / galactosamine-1-phosphate N-acetyltransferase